MHAKPKVDRLIIVSEDVERTAFPAWQGQIDGESEVV